MVAGPQRDFGGVNSLYGNQIGPVGMMMRFFIPDLYLGLSVRLGSLQNIKLKIFVSISSCGEVIPRVKAKDGIICASSAVRLA